jgi:dihydroorotase
VNSPVLLQRVRILDPVSGTDRAADVLIEKGIIRAIESDISSYPENTTVIAADSFIFAPGLVDLYSHSGEPGHEERETLASLIASATAGGFTRVGILPDTVPPLDNPAAVTTLIQKSQYLSSPTSARLQFWGTLTLNREGQQMAEIGDLLEYALGFTDSRGIEGTALTRRLLEYVQPFQKAIALFPVQGQLKGNGVMREGDESIRFGLPGDPAISETIALAGLLELIAEVRTPVHLMRISTRRGVELIRDAKERGVPVTASVTWLHLLLNTGAIATYDSSLRVDPPLGTESDRTALIQGIREGVIDAIAIDHRPYTYEEKTVAFAEAPPGAIGLELALPLLWEKLVATGELTPIELWRAMSVNPCLCTGQEPPAIEVRKPAEAILLDPGVKWTVTGESLQSLSRNTFWLNREISGRAIGFWNYRLSP